MTTRIPFPLLAAAAALMSGLATAPAVAQTGSGPFVSAPDGTVTVYERKSQGSYGSFEGPVTWTQSRRDWNGRTLVASTSQGFGTQLLDPQTHGVVAQLSNAGEPAYTYDPPVAYRFPLEVGNAWSSTHQMTAHARQAVMPLVMNFKVEAVEDVTVPAGTFKAWKVVSTDSFGETQQVWVVPSLGLPTLKRINDRPASHPLGAGHLEGVLASRVLPAR